MHRVSLNPDNEKVGSEHTHSGNIPSIWIALETEILFVNEMCIAIFSQVKCLATLLESGRRQTYAAYHKFGLCSEM